MHMSSSYLNGAALFRVEHLKWKSIRCQEPPQITVNQLPIIKPKGIQKYSTAVRFNYSCYSEIYYNTHLYMI